MDREKLNTLLQKRYSTAYYGSKPPKLKRLSTGFLGLDYILGGGLPKGRFIELSALASCGKTTTALQIIKELQLQGVPTCYIDLERTCDDKRVEELGLTEDQFFYFRPSDGEESFEILIDMVNAGVQFVVIDSVPFLVPKTTVENDVDKITLSPQARLMSRVQAKLVAAVEQSQACVMFINQLRDKIGSYGGGKDTTGGNALKYLCSVRLQIYRKSGHDDGSGMTLVYKTTKNKTCAEGRYTELDFYYESGLDKYSSLRNTLLEYNLLTRAGSYYKLSDELAQEFNITPTIGQGSKNADLWLANNPNFYKAMYIKCFNLINNLKGEEDAQTNRTGIKSTDESGN